MTPASPYSDLDRPPLNARALTRAVVRDGGFWRDVRVVDETGSTNVDVAALAREGAPEGLALVAEVQNAGRGRLGRTWTAPARSGLFFSVLLRPGAHDVPAPRWGWLPLLAGTAVRTAVERVTEVPARLKWPNDLIVPVDGEGADGGERGDGVAGGLAAGESAEETPYGVGRKLGGILVERVDTPGGPAAVVGVGLNVSLRRDELPAPHATSLVLAGAAHADRDPVLRAVLREIERWYEDWTAAAGDPEASGLASAYAASCATLGRRVRVELPAGKAVEGEAVGLDADGCLKVRISTPDSVREEVFSAGDVVHLR